MTGEPATETLSNPVATGATEASPAAPAPATQVTAVTASLGNTQKTALVIGGVVLAVILLLFVFMPKRKAE
jgi:hypothetical protein